MSSYNGKYFVGVDVGTQSVRAALVTEQGKIVKNESYPLMTWNPAPDMYEQSTVQIWQAICTVVTEATKTVDPSLVIGLGFDATCSLAILDKNCEPLTGSITGNSYQNVILWMDHRALEEANFINSKQHSVLKFVGGKISPEMEPPKLMWLKQKLPAVWEQLGYAFDLPDFLTWKATGSFSRSLCSLVCKWTYQAGGKENQGWQDSFWKEIGLEDLLRDNYKIIGSEVLAPGQPCGKGLTEDAASELGLLPGTPVGTSIIDAHAGGIGLLGCQIDKINPSFTTRISIIGGTSTCHMVVNDNCIFTPGIWGPYYSAMVPSMWLSEAGQSAAGALVDHVVSTHAAFNSLIRKAKEGRRIEETLNQLLESLRKSKKLPSVSHLTRDFHVWPDFHGNRSPLSDPSLKGMVCGLTLSSGEEDLAYLYLATMQALAYSTEHILESLKATGHNFSSILVCGGLAKNPLYVQLHADVTGLPVVLPEEKESVLLGAAILAGNASGVYGSVMDAMRAMGGKGKVVEPNKADSGFHKEKYACFLKLLKCQKDIQSIMKKC